MLSGTHSTRWWAVLFRLFVLLNVFIAILSKGAQPYGWQIAAAHRKRNRSAVQATPWLCMASVSSAVARIVALLSLQASTTAGTAATIRCRLVGRPQRRCLASQPASGRTYR